MARQLVFTLGLACLLAGSLFCGEGKAQSDSGGDTLEFFTPKTNMGDIRFAYTWGDAPKIELSNEQVMLGREFAERFPETNTIEFIESHYDEAIEGLPNEQEQFVFERITEWPSQRYCVFFPERFEMGLFRLDGVALKPTGDGGFYGFWGRLKHVAGADFQDSRLENSCAKALAFPCSQLKGRARPMDKEITDPNTLSTLLPAVAKYSKLGTPEIVKCREFYLAYPSQKGYLVYVRGEKHSGADYVYHPTVLYCLSKVGDGFELLPFPDEGMTGSEKDGGWLVETEEGPGYDLSPGNSKVYVLPDMDGDGGCEIYIVTTVSTLFRVVQEYSHEKKEWLPRIKFVAETYFGP